MTNSVNTSNTNRCYYESKDYEHYKRYCFYNSIVIDLVRDSVRYLNYLIDGYDEEIAATPSLIWDVEEQLGLVMKQFNKVNAMWQGDIENDTAFKKFKDNEYSFDVPKAKA